MLSRNATFVSLLSGCKHVNYILSLVIRMPGFFILRYLAETSPKWDLSFNLGLVLVLRAFAFMISVLIVLLPKRKLMLLYAHCLTMSIVAGENFFVRSPNATDQFSALFRNFAPLFYFIRSYHLQAVIALNCIVILVTFHLIGYIGNTAKSVVVITLIPAAIYLMNLPSESLWSVYSTSSFSVYGVLMLHYASKVPRLSEFLESRFAQAIRVIQDRGVLSFLQEFWDSIMYHQLLTYWCFSIVYHLYQFLDGQELPGSRTMVGREWYVVAVYLASIECGSFIGLLAFTAVVMIVTRAVHQLVKLMLQGKLHDNLQAIGRDEAITVVLLAVQLGLTGLPLPLRMMHSALLMFIALGMLFQSLHVMVEPILLSLGASNCKDVSRHFRVVSLALVLLICTTYLSCTFISTFAITFWSMLIASSFYLTAIQVFTALCVYALFVYDTLVKNCSWELLDDGVYGIRAYFHAIENIIALVISVAGVRELAMSKSLPMMSTVALAIHIYFNVYAKLKASWTSFTLRNNASRKVKQLPKASKAQIQSRSHDVCSICLIAMKSARLTPCGHLFHQHCLKKWLYVEDRCPLCSTAIGGQTQVPL